MKSFAFLTLITFTITTPFQGVFAEKPPLASPTSTLSEKTCIINRALFDIGSGATKFYFTKVNICTGAILKKLYKQDIAVPYQKALNASTDNTFSQEIIDHGLQTLRQMKATAQNIEPIDEAFGLATAAFRQARNGSSALQLFKTELNIPIHIISQETEAVLGLKSVRLNPLNNNKESILVWDIGGGSQQIITDQTPKGPVTYIGSGIGGETFQKMIIELVKKEDSSEIHSPNPIGPDNIQAAIQLAHSLIKFPPKNSFNILQYNKTHRPTVVGIGCVHKAIVRVASKDKKSYTKADLLHKIRELSDKNDATLIQLGSPSSFVGHEVSNMILVYAMMDAFNINKVCIDDSNTVDVLMLEGKELFNDEIQHLHQSRSHQHTT